MSFSTTPGGLIVSPAPIYDYLAARGHRAEREYNRIEGWLVQFLQVEKPLYADALAHAVTRDAAQMLRASRAARPADPVRPARG